VQFSHSRIDVFKNCKYKYKLQYIDKLKVLPNTDAINALFLGTAVHTGVEKDAETAVKEYYMSYPIITDEHVNEAIKLEYLIPIVKEMLPKGKHELQIMSSDFIGYMDLLVSATVFERGVELPNTYDLYDFKYSNNVKNYMDSGQLHEYKYFWEKQNPGKKIRNMYFVFVPKVQIKQKKTEDLYQFRQRILAELQKTEVKIVQIEYDPNKVIEFALEMKHVLETKEFSMEKNYLCNWCDYQAYCEKGEDYMILPKNERRTVGKISKKVIWLYGAPFSGKTFLANKFPDPLMLNTDGNIKFVDSPYIPIKDVVTVEGRITKRTLAWAVLKDTISELEKKQNDFKTIVVDLLEDTYEACRLFMYDQMGITHESDDSFRAWDKVRTEFLSTLKRLINMDYENIILISHEDTSKDITKKGGDKVTAIKPNLQEKTANKVAGMVDIVARVIADDNVRTLNFKTNEVIFGGGRLNVTANTIPLNYDELMKVYEEANSGAKAEPEQPREKTSRTKKAEKTEAEKADKEVFQEDTYFYHPESDAYFMCKKGDEVPTDADFQLSNEITKEVYENAIEKLKEIPAVTDEPKQEEAPKTRTRRQRTEEAAPEEQKTEEKAPQEEQKQDTTPEEQPKTRTRKKREA
jgi:phage nucleotide-binding protein